MKFKILLIPLAIVLIGLYSAAYVIDMTDQVVITQFGKVIGKPITEPGLYFKLPIIQKANYFKKNLLEWDGDRGEIPTYDKTYIWVDTFARWKIVDALKFFQTLNNMDLARDRLNGIINAAVRDSIATYPLIEAVRMTNRKLVTIERAMDQISEKRVLAGITKGREKIVEDILAKTKPELLTFGIELVDVAIKRINYTEKVRRSVYDRMIAEREQIAEKHRSEGLGSARKIEGKRNKELKRITSEAYRTAQEIKGKADAEATLIFARAYNEDPEFYAFLKTLEVYKNTIDEDSSLVLSTDSDFMKYFKSLE